jgi:light-regulated signal transduction histidine kinase (bacteriophytochrome)
MEDCLSPQQISEFLLRACHDLRTPSRAIRTHSELLMKQAESGWNQSVEERLAFLVDGARKLDVILDGIVSYSLALQIDPAMFQPVRLDIQMRAVLLKLGGILRENGAEVTAGDLPEVMGQPERLFQLLEALLRNSLAHRGDNPPRIHLDAVRDDGNWLFTLRDNGPGIEPDYLEHVFRPFERMRRHHNEGAGMGLAICREIVQRHGGNIWAEAAETGACFRFTLTAPG